MEHGSRKRPDGDRGDSADDTRRRTSRIGGQNPETRPSEAELAGLRSLLSQFEAVSLTITAAADFTISPGLVPGIQQLTRHKSNATAN